VQNRISVRGVAAKSPGGFTLIAKTRPVAAAVVALLAAAIFLVPAALAGKGGGGGKPGGGGTTGGGGSISLAPLVYDANGNGLPNWGDTVTFNVSTTATDQPYVNLKCSQNGILVANGSAGYFPGALNSGYDFTLNSPSWTGGAAVCTAYLGMYTRQGWSQLGSTSFNVGA